MADLSQYPEHQKLALIQSQSQAAGEFIEWLAEQRWAICQFVGRPEGYFPISQSRDQLLAEFFDIDQMKIDNEKRAMLDHLRGLD